MERLNILIKEKVKGNYEKPVKKQRKIEDPTNIGKL